MRKRLQDDDLPISASCLQSPVLYVHSEALYPKGSRPLSTGKALVELERIGDISLGDENDSPRRVSDTSGIANLSIGCTCNDYGTPELLQFWLSAANIRFGGTLIAVKISEKLLNKHWYWLCLKK